MRYIFLLFLLPVSLMMRGQLTAPGSSSVRYSAYPANPGVKDPLFFYCNITGTERGTLNAVRPRGSGLYTFTWYQWNTGTSSFSILIKTEADAESSVIDNLSDGGYRVDIDKSGVYDTSLVGWVFLDKKPVAEASLLDQKCFRIALYGKARPAIKNFTYYNPANGVPASFKNEISFTWSSDPTSLIPFPTFDTIKIIDSPPLEDVTYKIAVNSLGCSGESSFFYESIHVKADFTAEPVTGEAPLEVAFTNKSIRGYTFYWDFGDDSISTLENPPPHTYYRPGEYNVKLGITSDKLCTDTLIFEKIVVEPSKLEIPNVFTPDGDGINDFFIVESKSLRSIDVEIYSKSGIKVYSFYGEGQVLSGWQGWDGNVNRSSIKATPGVYFYIIRAKGWDDKLYDSKEQRGFLYLYR